jgi:hypothetical protein
MTLTQTRVTQLRYHVRSQERDVDRCTVYLSVRIDREYPSVNADSTGDDSSNHMCRSNRAP